jgi:hypothetical protein
MITGFMIVLLVLFLYYKSNFHGRSEIELHFSTHCSGDGWSLELFVLSNWRTNRKDTLIKMQQEERKKSVYRKKMYKIN